MIRSIAVLDEDLQLLGVGLSPADPSEAATSILDKMSSLSRAHGDLYSRHIIELQEPSSSSFSVKQFNLLAEGLSAPPRAQPPLAASGEDYIRSDYGGFDSVTEPETVFDFRNFRKWRLLSEILRPDSIPDVLAVQECDHYHDFFAPALKCFGYEGAFCPKARSRCCSYGYYSDGVAIFWRSGVFKKLKIDDDVDPVVCHVSVLLEHIESKKTVIVASCHLKAKCGAANETIRLNQIQHVLRSVSIFGTIDGSVPRMLLLGDFNTVPSDHKTPKDEKVSVISFLQDWENRSLNSAYPFFDDETKRIAESPWVYSTWKFRDGQECKRLIDYIWYSSRHFEVAALQSLPALSELSGSAGRLPDVRYPSDHCALYAKFNIIC